MLVRRNVYKVLDAIDRKSKQNSRTTSSGVFVCKCFVFVCAFFCCCSRLCLHWLIICFAIDGKCLAPFTHRKRIFDRCLLSGGSVATLLLTHCFRYSMQLNRIEIQAKNTINNKATLCSTPPPFHPSTCLSRLSFWFDCLVNQYCVSVWYWRGKRRTPRHQEVLPYVFLAAMQTPSIVCAFNQPNWINNAKSFLVRVDFIFCDFIIPEHGSKPKITR